MRNILRWSVCGALVAAAVSGCSGDGGQEPEGLATSEVCDGTLTGPAAKALERIGGTDRFEELTSTNDIGDPVKFSLGRAAKRLHTELGQRSECSLYKADDDSGYYMIKMQFEPTASRPDPENASRKNSAKDDRSVFPLGLYAYVPEDDGASLFFSCTTKGPEGSTPYVAANMFVNRKQVDAVSTAKDRMVVLNAVSRALAEQLGCAAQAKLPAEVPDALPG
ncbi:hypothetical protein [Streptomyces pratensis]|jgi:hypothetical protein|uniref:hypothetical protein n=1 Tax=Streptomyces pratensis TaxID=1169025 RepID=UPI0019322804|nr:hypothetical protein [Streptomyces pratensis]